MEELGKFLKSVEEQVRPLRTEANRENWLAQTTGEAAHQNRSSELQATIMHFYSDANGFAQAKSFKDSAGAGDPLQQRELDAVYRAFLRNRIGPQDIAELNRLQKEVSAEYVNFRADLDGRRVSDNELREILENDVDSARRRRAWEASKQIGSVVAKRVLELVSLRNRIARQLGFDDYFSMALSLSELDENDVFDAFDRLKGLSDEPFKRAKSALDSELAARFHVPVEALRPWHYSDPFFQEAPRMAAIDLDACYAGRDLEELAVRYYDGIGLEVRDILKRSDLYERSGKCQHAFCTHIDGNGDIRILANLRPEVKSMTTLLHELGHGVYSKFLDPALPYTLRTAAHSLTTEAVAQLHGRMARTAEFLSAVAGLPDRDARSLGEAVSGQLRLTQLIFARWGLTVVYFERELYRNPEQDLNRLWWDTAERMQMLKRPEGRDEPDWAAKFHLANYPAYYQNYVLGEMVASQLWSHLCGKVVHGTSIVGRPEAGAYLVEKVFRPGARFHWNDMLERATGEKLNPEHFVKQFVAE